MRFFGLDWFAIGLSLLALRLIGNRNRYGFVSFMGANLCWMGFSVVANSPAIGLGNLLFFASNLRSFVIWRRSAPSWKGS